ncbi:MAG: acyl-CoA dehydrogenase family protein [Actinomycetota bacterium]|nr:acyl-CoA dehydrogenase family protein [Actinomycetota bacterium]
MDFEPSARATEYLARMQDFLDEAVYPAEPVYAEQRRSLAATGQLHTLPPVVELLKADARSRGLWNLFLPDSHDPAHGLSVLEYAPIAELSGRSVEIAPEAINCAAPDTGNMELLHMFGTDEQKHRWLEPLLAGTIRSGFAMTEPGVASSDATNIETSIRREGDEYVMDGRKWWTTGANDPRCSILIVMGKTDPAADRHRQQSMVLVPLDTPGVEVVRGLPVFGYHDQHGHAEITFTGVRVPVANVLGEEGSGFALAQARLGPGRIHHCMRAIGMAERALDLMTERALSRVAFGEPLAKQGVVREQIAESRLEIEQARLLTLKAAWMIDRVGAKGARVEIAAIKVAAPRAALNVLDRAIQVFGGMGVSDDVPLAQMWALARTLRLADGPDEVHLRDIARAELRRHLT